MVIKKNIFLKYRAESTALPICPSFNDWWWRYESGDGWWVGMLNWIDRRGMIENAKSARPYTIYRRHHVRSALPDLEMYLTVSFQMLRACSTLSVWCTTSSPRHYRWRFRSLFFQIVTFLIEVSIQSGIMKDVETTIMQEFSSFSSHLVCSGARSVLPP